jgi:predicted enzyme related to lactoylglutathione lyase
MTKDKPKALQFYTQLFGWNVSEMDMGEHGTYPMIGVGEKSLGGVVALKEESIPAHWIAYVTVDNVDGATDKARQMGGSVHVAPTDIPGIGRFSAIADPQGATIYPFKFEGDAPPEEEGPPVAGHFCWNELLTSDPQAASDFYKSVFGWSVQTSDMGEMGTYWLLERGSKQEAGMMTMPPEAEAPPHWLPYIAVDDVDRTVKMCDELGGKTYYQATDIPDVGRFAVLADPEGAPFAVFKGAAK